MKNTHIQCPNHSTSQSVCATKVVLALQNIIIEKKYERVLRPVEMDLDEIDNSF